MTAMAVSRFRPFAEHPMIDPPENSHTDHANQTENNDQEEGLEDDRPQHSFTVLVPQNIEVRVDNEIPVLEFTDDGGLRKAPTNRLDDIDQLERGDVDRLVDEQEGGRGVGLDAHLGQQLLVFHILTTLVDFFGFFRRQGLGLVDEAGEQLGTVQTLLAEPHQQMEGRNRLQTVENSLHFSPIDVIFVSFEQVERKLKPFF